MRDGPYLGLVSMTRMEPTTSTPEGAAGDPERKAGSSEQTSQSLLFLGISLLRARRVIVALGLAGALIGGATGLMKPRTYRASATIIPQSAEASGGGLAAFAASQLGVRVSSGFGGSWGAPVYVELLKSRALLEPIAMDSVVVAEQSGRLVPVADLLGAEASSPAARAEAAVERLRSAVTATEDKKLSAVEISVITQWPSVSLALTERLVARLNQFNLETRKSQAAAERQFVEIQAADAGRQLLQAEDRLQGFLQRNRQVISPELVFERDRLQREVGLRQQLYTDWLKSREEARIREIRDTPVITVLEEPRKPLRPEARGSVRRAMMGGLIGGGLGILVALFWQALVRVRKSSSEESQEFFSLLSDAAPRLRKARPSVR